MGKLKRKYRHSEDFRPKSTLLQVIETQRRLLANDQQTITDLAHDVQILRTDLRIKNEKIINDAMLIDELKHQVAQQHVQLCNARENTRELREGWATKVYQKQAVWDQRQAQDMLAKIHGIGNGVVTLDPENSADGTLHQPV